LHPSDFSIKAKPSDVAPLQGGIPLPVTEVEVVAYEGEKAEAAIVRSMYDHALTNTVRQEPKHYIGGSPKPLNKEVIRELDECCCRRGSPTIRLPVTRRGHFDPTKRVHSAGFSEGNSFKALSDVYQKTTLVKYEFGDPVCMRGDNDIVPKHADPLKVTFQTRPIVLSALC